MFLKLNILLIILKICRNFADISEDFSSDYNYEIDSSIENLFLGKGSVIPKGRKCENIINGKNISI